MSQRKYKTKSLPFNFLFSSTLCFFFLFSIPFMRINFWSLAGMSSWRWLVREEEGGTIQRKGHHTEERAPYRGKGTIKRKGHHTEEGAPYRGRGTIQANEGVVAKEGLFITLERPFWLFFL
jgi:hypothetical protein